MKTLSKILAVFAFVCIAFSVSTASTEAPNNISSTEVFSNSCVVYVSTSSNYPARSMRVTTEVSGGISCIGGREFRTDSDGMVTLDWISGCSLKKIYVDGRGYEVDYRDGNTYYLTMK